MKLIFGRKKREDEVKEAKKETGDATGEIDQKVEGVEEVKSEREAEGEIQKAAESEKKEIEADKVVEEAKRRKKALKGKGRIFEAYNPEIHGPLIEYHPPDGFEVVDEYWLQEPYVKAFVIYSDELHEYRYIVVEPELNAAEAELYNIMKLLLRERLQDIEVKSDDVKEEVLRQHSEEILRSLKLDIEPKSYYKVLYHLIRDLIWYERITPLMLDRYLEDISCNGYRIPIFVFHRNYTNVETNVVFEHEEELDAFIVTLAQRCGKHISIADPMLDATMPDGSRIQMTLGREVTDHGSTFTIRKFRDEPVTPIDLIAWGTFSAEQMAYLWLCIENKKSLIFAGGTASGKTTSMNAISLFIPKRAKIVTIEDTRELMLPHENWIPAVTRETFQDERGNIDMYDLLRAALRQRPEYIIVGEVRGREAQTLFQAMSTGHTTYSTLHADSVNGAIHRLENPPINVPRAMLEALDIISIQAQTYVGNKRVRRNIEIAEIIGMDPYTKMIRTVTVFAWDSVKDKHTLVGNSKALETIRMSRGWSQKELLEEIERREKILEFMIEHNIRDFRKVASIIHTYQTNPDKLMKEILGGGHV
jgi:flagellar protein FlaI